MNDQQSNTTICELVLYQQQAFQRLMGATLNAYINVFRFPYTLYQVEVNATEHATQAAMAATRRQREQAQLWTLEHPLQEAESDRPVLVRVDGPGMVHAGINQDGKWIRTYDAFLDEVSPGVWEAILLDPEIDEFTFAWYDQEKAGKVRWEGKNHCLPRRPQSA